MSHTGIDGYSRSIVYLQCSGNNKSSTVYKVFLEAVTQYRLPSQVRSDQGRENILVAQHMIEHRGLDRGSMIVGSSVHNQRIDPLSLSDNYGIELYEETAEFVHDAFRQHVCSHGSP